MRAATARKTDTNTPVVKKEYIAHYKSFVDSRFLYVTTEKGRSTPIGKILIKVSDVPRGFVLKPVHPVDELQIFQHD